MSNAIDESLFVGSKKSGSYLGGTRFVRIVDPWHDDLSRSQRTSPSTCHEARAVHATGEPVQPNTPQFLPKIKLPAQRLAPRGLILPIGCSTTRTLWWLRVTVNRFWQQIFGVGIVKTSEDFGNQGQPPVHPELLDHLASQFRKDGWNIKKLIRELVCSQRFGNRRS